MKALCITLRPADDYRPQRERRYNRTTMRKPSIISKWIEEWRQLRFYERFEQIIAILLSLIVSLIAVLSLTRLGSYTVSLFANSSELFQYTTFISLFGMIIPVLIALEFNHTIVQIVERKQSIVQIRVVIIIAMLAVIRKFIVIDVEQAENSALLVDAGVVLALGTVYWLVQDSDRRREKPVKREDQPVKREDQ